MRLAALVATTAAVAVAATAAGAMTVTSARIVRTQQPAFAQALAPESLEFPRDRGPHPDYRQEWWYLTGNLDAGDGERFGFELTIFRFALAPGAPASVGAGSRPGARRSPWRTNQIYLGHFAITDVARHRFRFTVKLARGALGLAGAQTDPLRVWVGNWRIGEHGLQAAGKGYALSLTMQPLLPPVLNGERGWSRKSAERGNATYYYSIPRVAVQGTIIRDGRPLRVRGLAWLDREWGSGSLGPRQVGWDWFGLQLGDGSSLMFYSLRDRGGTQDPYSAGTWVDPAGHTRPLSRADVRIEVLDSWTDAGGARYPSRWRLSVPAIGLDVTIHPVLADQELMTSPRYWEGAVDLSGTRAGRRVAGRGYVELVGYAGTTAGSAGIR
jgi:predicted secreted hydrolase